MNFMKNVIVVSISIPTNILSEIDKTRKDVSRSRFILRMLEKSNLEYNCP